MSRLENLQEVADRNLGGLKADARLLHRILNTETKKPQPKIRWKPVLAIGTAFIVLLVTGIIALPQLLRYEGDISVVTKSAGGDNEIQGVQLTANVPTGSVNISESSGNTRTLHSLFAPGDSANFPLIKIGNAAYRMLVDSVTASSGQLGGELGSVTEYTSQPAISNASIVSNTVQANEPVYAIRGMDSAMIAAQVQGSMRVFQRVSYSGIATLGSESLKQVLTGNAAVTAMELSGIGRINRADIAQDLMNVLYSYAQYQSAAQITGGELLIYLDNGLVVQMNVKDGMLSACGTWSCPEFFDAFQSAVSE